MATASRLWISGRLRGSTTLLIRERRQATKRGSGLTGPHRIAQFAIAGHRHARPVAALYSGIALRITPRQRFTAWSISA